MKSFVSTDPHTHQGDNIWFTPKKIIDILGPFDTDVCTISKRPFDTARAHIEHDKGQDSLCIDWAGFVWMNPPYGKEIEPFIEKFKKHNNGIGLVFARMGTPWMQRYIKESGQLFFLRKRIGFLNRNGEKQTNAGADSCFLVGGGEAHARILRSGIEGVFLK